MVNTHNHKLLVFIVFFDLILLISVFLFARFLTGFNMFSWKLREIIASIALITVLYIALERFEFSHSYRFKPFISMFKKVVAFEIFLLAIFYVIKALNIFEYHDKFVAFYCIITFLVLFFERAFIKIILMILRSKGYNYKNYLIVGAGEVGLDFYRLTISNNELGIRVVGFLDDNVKLLNSEDPVYTDKVKSLILGTTSKLETILKTRKIDNVIVALPMHCVEKIITLFQLCEKYGVRGELIPRYSKIISNNPSVRKIKNFSLIGLHDVPLENLFNRFIKRLFDICFSFTGIFFLLPLFIIISILIKLNSKGPVFFLQKRTGYNQKDFHIIKFRTMKMSNNAHTKQATKDDPRKTKFGDFLRRKNIDELPQLFNILIGDMSLIGPRPHMLAHTEEFNKKYDKYLIRHWVKPGLTGWAQVNGWRGQSDIGMRVKYDLDYIENWSLMLDLKISFLTIFGKKVKRHAY